MTVKPVSQIIYGTAWKEDRTQELVELAIKKGFRAFDTANQPKHYQEHLVGQAIQEAISKGMKREEFFIQTKFTPQGGHDNRIPYSLDKSLPERVHESFESSLNNLSTETIDSYLLHGPHSFPGLCKEDIEVWKALEEIYNSGKAKSIGVSNVNLQQLETLCELSSVTPMVVQNRCYADRAWDQEVRDFCKQNSILYQGFSLLTANPAVYKIREIGQMASKYQVTIGQLIFRFSSQLGIIPLTGTTDPIHMEEDLKVFEFSLNEDEIHLIENCSI